MGCNNVLIGVRKSTTYKVPEKLKYRHILNRLKIAYYSMYRYLLADGVFIPPFLIRYTHMLMLEYALINKNGNIASEARSVYKMIQAQKAQISLVDLYNYINSLNISDEKKSWLRGNLNKFLDYINSNEFKELMTDVQKVNSLKRRIEIITNLWASYVYNRFTDFEAFYNYSLNEAFNKNILKQYLEVEEKHFGVLKKGWSNKYVWFSLIGYFNVLKHIDDYNYVVKTIAEVRYNNLIDDVDLVIPENYYRYRYNDFARFYDLLFNAKFDDLVKNAIKTLNSDIVSAFVADRLRKFAVRSLVFLGRGLFILANFFPALRGAGLLARATYAIANWLDKSFLARILWDIGVEWKIDGFIQSVFNFYDRFVANVEEYFGLSKDELNELIKYLKMEFNGEYFSEWEKQRYGYLFSKLSERGKTWFLNLAVKLRFQQRLLNLKKQKFREGSNYLDNIDVGEVSLEKLERFFIFPFTNAPIANVDVNKTGSGIEVKYIIEDNCENKDIYPNLRLAVARKSIHTVNNQSVDNTFGDARITDIILNAVEDSYKLLPSFRFANTQFVLSFEKMTNLLRSYINRRCVSIRRLRNRKYKRLLLFSSVAGSFSFNLDDEFYNYFVVGLEGNFRGFQFKFVKYTHTKLNRKININVTLDSSGLNVNASYTYSIENYLSGEFGFRLVTASICPHVMDTALSYCLDDLNRSTLEKTHTHKNNTFYFYKYTQNDTGYDELSNVRCVVSLQKVKLRTNKVNTFEYKGKRSKVLCINEPA